MEAIYRPAKFVEHEMEKGTNEPSFLSVVHEQAGERLSAEEQDIATYSAHSLYGGASDTVSSLKCILEPALMDCEDRQHTFHILLDDGFASRNPA